MDAPAAPPGLLLVEIAPDIAIWAAAGGFDAVVRGQVLSRAPAVSVSLRDADGPELASVAFGQREPPLPVTLPDGEAGFQRGFQICLPFRGGAMTRVLDLVIEAEALDGALFRESLRLGCRPDQAAVISGPVGASPPPPPATIVYPESAHLDAHGVLRVHGWTLSRSPIVAVQVLMGQARVGPAAHGRERADVGAAFPDFPNAAQAGFLFDAHVPDDLEPCDTVSVEVLSLSGASHVAILPLRRDARAVVEAPVEASGWDSGRAILMVCDQAAIVGPDTLRVEGWAYRGHGIARIGIEVDGQEAGDAEHGLDRPDVAGEYPGIPAAIGFAFEKHIWGVSDGVHQVRIIVFSDQGDEKSLIVPITNPERPEFRLELDKPVTRDGIAVDPITGRLLIEGWALARDGMDTIDVALDGAPLGQAHYGMARPDVGLTFPGWENAARSGYTFHCPPRALPDGDHLIEITARSKTGGTRVHAFRVTIRKPDNPEETASIRRHVKAVERNTVDAMLTQLGWRPRFHLVVVAAEGASETALGLTLRSIREQSWAYWRVTVLGDVALPSRWADERIVVAPSWDVEDADLIGFLAIGDELGRDALGAFAMASGLHPAADCFYADEFRLPPGGTRPDAFFKPDFSPALLLSTNYIGRPLVLRPAVLAASGITAVTLARDGFHHFALCCARVAMGVHHVPDLLSRTDTGVVSDIETSDAAVSRWSGGVVEPGMVPGTWRTRPAERVMGKVSIIIPTRAAKMYIETCLTTLRDVTAYRNFEIVVIDNIPEEDTAARDFVRGRADKIVRMAPPFNWSRFNNAAAAAADGEFLLFLNDDMEIVEPGWLDALLDEISAPGVGIVGARLLYPNRTVQHAGMFLGHGMGRHAFRHAEATEPGYFGLALTRREVIAVTGACLLVRRADFDRLGRFDEAHDVINNDLDFCLRSHRSGLRTIYTPFATLIHHELASRSELKDDYDTSRFSNEWRGLFAAGDPYFNPRISRYSDDFLVDDEGTRVMYSGHPLIEAASVRSILVVKLDHIGDFITALPAIRRLKLEFPGSRITALVAPASAAIASVEPAIDECIPFEFFHARSELGEKELSEDDLAALTARLAPYRFDVAVDLRKHLSTRSILLCAGARLTAGFDSLETFPWLDVALEWDGDKALQRKRGHIVDDLLNLVTAISVACETPRGLFDPVPAAMKLVDMPEAVRHLFARPVVAIHPGSGNVMRQLPEKHIPALIDLLIRRNDVSVMLVGGRDDEAKAAALVARVARPDRVASAAGLVALRDLPALFAACHLFIGGNSGPKHIAAGAGVPTIGVHSGVVDPGEWGPMGERTVALYRDMSCAPCFLAKPEHCPRALACVELMEPALVHRMAEMFLAVPVRQAVVEPVVVAAVVSGPEPARVGRKRRLAAAK